MNRYTAVYSIVLVSDFIVYFSGSNVVHILKAATCIGNLGAPTCIAQFIYINEKKKIRN